MSFSHVSGHIFFILRKICSLCTRYRFFITFYWNTWSRDYNLNFVFGCLGRASTCTLFDLSFISLSSIDHKFFGSLRLYNFLDDIIKLCSFWRFLNLLCSFWYLLILWFLYLNMLFIYMIVKIEKIVKFFSAILTFFRLHLSKFRLMKSSKMST